MSEVLIKDVAEYAGVHRTTASKILNNDPSCKIAAATRKRVLKAAESLGFDRNRNLDIPKEVKNIALIGIRGRYREENPFYYDVFEGVNVAAQDNKLNLYLLNELSRISLTDLVNQKSLLGMIAIGGITENLALALEMAHKPLVAIEMAQDIQSTFVYTVKTESSAATYSTTKYLMECGHTHIYYIGFKNPDGSEDPHSFERFNGVARALREAGRYHENIRFQANRNIQMDGREVYDATDVGKRSMRMLLATHPPKPFACVCYSDLHAVGAYEAAQEAGLRVPEDVSFTGYDDIPVAEKMSPPLTTTQVPRLELGTCAVQTILDHEEGNSRRHIQILDTTFIERDSVLRLK